MTTAVLIDGAPVALVGARRLYATARLSELNTPDRAIIVALCDTLVIGTHASGVASPRQPASERRR